MAKEREKEIFFVVGFSGEGGGGGVDDVSK